MAILLVFILIISMSPHSSATWCVCKKGGQDNVLQQAIDYACGNGADCTQTHKGGKCFDPDTVLDHCNYAVNSYFQNKGQSPQACVFNGAAMVVTSDPSSNGCTYPTSASGTGGSTNTHSPGSNPTSTFGNNPSNTGTLGGGMGGLGPSASSMDTDVSQGGLTLRQQTNIVGIFVIASAGVMMLMM
ncbi:PLASMODESMATA CALLOSE-BINDING PROTEIN 2-like [Rutidosis leptorrhynchoides]|uniref:PLASMODESMATA CALLOSE-BINDING PROTEIN 2-like n=1 Tax=Rutidosis leptorrhynchoides TaxID=125765 RepID=UPI003A9969A5